MEREMRREEIEMLIGEERRESYQCFSRGVNLEVDSPVYSDRGEEETGGERGEG